MKTTKGGKVMNPTDAYRKELRKKELKRNKKERKKVREVGILKKDPEAIKDQIQKLEMMKADGALDKARKHKKRQLEDTLNMVMKKRKEYEEKMREKGEAPVMFSHLGPPRRPGHADDQAVHPKPEDSVYYHPTLNPTGAPPPGKLPMYRSPLGPDVPSSSTAADGSMSISEEGEMSFAAPPPPPPSPLPDSTLAPDDSDLALSAPPPPPPGQPKPSQNLSLPSPAFPPPPPPGPPPSKESTSGVHPEDKDEENPQNQGKSSEVASLHPPPPPPPPPPGLPPSHILALQQGHMRFPMQPDMLPPGIPPPPHLPYPPGMAMAPPLPLMPRPPFGGGHGLPPMFRPPLPPGQPPFYQEESAVAARPLKPSYVKSAASTVVKRPLAQHNLELTSMVPASVRVRRESAAPKMKPRAQLLAPVAASSKPSTPAMIKSQPSSSSSSSKMQSIDDSYTAFLEDMKALGALDS